MDDSLPFLTAVQKFDDYIISCQDNLKNSENMDMRQANVKSLVYHTKFCILLSLLKNYYSYRRWIGPFPVEISLNNDCLRLDHDARREYFVNDKLESLIDEVTSSYDFSKAALNYKENDDIRRTIYRDLHVKEGTEDELEEFKEVKVICKNVFDTDINRSLICFHFVEDDFTHRNTPKCWTIEYINNQTKETSVIYDFTENCNFTLKGLFTKLFDKMING